MIKRLLVIIALAVLLGYVFIPDTTINTGLSSEFHWVGGTYDLSKVQLHNIYIYSAILLLVTILLMSIMALSPC